MTQLKQLRKQAKERGLKGYTQLKKSDLELLLAGKRVPKRLRKNQVSIGTQTDFPPCNGCGLKALVTHLRFKADAEERRRIIHDGELEIDADTGEIVGYEVDYTKNR